MKEKIADMLVNNIGKYVSGEALSSRLHISRTAVWKHIRELRRKGYLIQAAPRKGYCLTQRPDLLLPEEIKRYLNTTSVGKKIECWRTIDSTNRRAKELASQGALQGTVVVSREQTVGRGRVKNKWFSPAGGIWFSVILTPQIIPQKASLFNLLASLAVVNGIQKVSAVPLQIKWPNDIYLGKRKLAGILTEISAEMDQVNSIVVGVGINAKVDSSSFPDEIKKTAASLWEETEEELFLPEILGEILNQLELLYQRSEKEGFEGILEEWRGYDLLKGRDISIDTPSGRVSGKAAGVNSRGALLLESEEENIEAVLAGTVIF